jgi:hypothetical protein
MRAYPRNSPAAAARIVALALLADGHLSRTELAALLRQEAHERLGVSPLELQDILQHLAEDLTSIGAPVWTGGVLDETLVAALLHEVDDPGLQRTVLGLCNSTAEADGVVTDGEHVVLDACRRRWRIVEALQ